MSRSKNDVLSTFLRLSQCGALPTLNLDSDEDLVMWAAETNATLDAMNKENSGSQTNDNNNNSSNSNPDFLLTQFVNLLCSHLHIRGYDDIISLHDVANKNEKVGGTNALPKGAQQLLRHGNDVARIAMMAQRLAEEVTELQQAKLRMQQQHGQELAQQAASYREVIAGLLEQQAKLERKLSFKATK